MLSSTEKEMDSHTPIAFIIENDLLQRKKIKDDFLKYLKDKTIPLDKRWTSFCDYGKDYLPIYNWVRFNYKFDNGTEICLLDHYNCEKYTLNYYSTFIEWAEQNCYEDSDECYGAITGQNLINIKEDILASGYCGFINDW